MKLPGPTIPWTYTKIIKGVYYIEIALCITVPFWGELLARNAELTYFCYQLEQAIEDTRSPLVETPLHLRDVFNGILKWYQLHILGIVVKRVNIHLLGWILYKPLSASWHHTYIKLVTWPPKLQRPYRWYPTKRDLPAMFTHGWYGPLAGYTQYINLMIFEANNFPKSHNAHRCDGNHGEGNCDNKHGGRTRPNTISPTVTWGYLIILFWLK